MAKSGKIIDTTIAKCSEHFNESLQHRIGDIVGHYWECPQGCDPLMECDVYLEWNESIDFDSDVLVINEHEAEDDE